MPSAERLLRSAPVRILLAAAPIVLWLIVAGKLHLPMLAAGLVVPFLYAGYVRVVERRAVDEFGARGAVPEAASGFAIGAALFTITIAILMLVGVATVTRGDGWRALAGGLATALAAALVEETLLRAIFFRLVESSLGSSVALAASAALFGVLHVFNPGANLVSTVAIALEAGVLLAAAFVYTRRMWMAIGLHAAWNFTEGGIFGASVSGGPAHGLLRSTFHGPTLLTGGAFGPEASIVAIAVCLAAGVALVMRARARGAWRGLTDVRSGR